MWYMLDHCANKVEQNGKWGLADGDGNVISPCVWEEMCDFSCQRAAVGHFGVEGRPWEQTDIADKLKVLAGK